MGHEVDKPLADALSADDSSNSQSDARPASRSRWVSRLAIVVGVVTCSACVAALYRTSKAAHLKSLRIPFRQYDETMPGCRAMPSRADQYDGLADERPVTVNSVNGTVNVFVIGDWGATLPNHVTFSPGCCDGGAQFNVANAFKQRGDWADPQYVLNVGDNFYVAGLDMHDCQQPPNHGADETKAAFSSAWQGMYGKYTNKPWISVLGNHDYGGWRMDKGWPQQIGYSFMNYNWIMPGRFYTKRINHTGFFIDYFMIDSNAFDAKDPGVNPDHNICGSHNYGGAGLCSNNGAMSSIEDCKPWFWRTYAAQKEWLTAKVKASDARWKVVVTHFPCGYDSEYWRSLKAHGLDLMVTGHRHQQELWKPGTTSKYISSFMLSNKWDHDAPACFVTGGGGGIISQKFAYADYGTDLQWYGFFHLTIHKDWMKIELVKTDGGVAGDMVIYPHGSQAAQDHYNDQPENKGHIQYTCESYCGDNNNPWTKVCAWGFAPWMSCAGCDGCLHACESYCGDTNNPFDKVCPWGTDPWATCHDCDGCKHKPTPAPPPSSTNQTNTSAEQTITN